MSTPAGEALLGQLAAGRVDSDVPDRLLAEIFAGFPPQRLRSLLRSDNDAIVEAAAWILSELGPLAATMLDDVALLLEHKARKARFFALDVVLTCAGVGDADLIGKAVALVEDPDEAVQWKAMRFLTALPIPLLTAGWRTLPMRFDPLIRWIVSPGADESYVEELWNGLEDPDPTRRRLAAVAAARSKDKPWLLARARESTDPPIRDFARSVGTRT